MASRVLFFVLFASTFTLLTPPTFGQSEQALVRKAIQAGRAGKLTQAAQLWKQLTQLSPKNQLYKLNLGATYCNQGKFELGIRLLESVWKGGGEFSNPAGLALSRAYRAQVEPEKARQVLNQIRQSANDPQAVRLAEFELEALSKEKVQAAERELSLGVKANERRNFQLAIQHFRNSIELSLSGEGYLGLALAHLGLGQATEASQALESALPLLKDAEMQDEALRLRDQIFKSHLDVDSKSSGNFLAASIGWKIITGYGTTFYAMRSSVPGQKTDLDNNHGAFLRSHFDWAITLVDWSVLNSELAYQFSYEDAFGDFSRSMLLTHFLRNHWNAYLANWHFQVSPYAAYQYFHSSSILSKFGIGGSASFEKSNHLAGVDGYFDKDRPGNDQVPTLGGFNWLVGARYGYDFGSFEPSLLGFLQRKEGYLYRNQFTFSEAFKSFGFGSELNWEFFPKWSLYGFSTLTWKRLLSSASGSSFRSDLESFTRGKILWNISDILQLGLGAEFITTFSTDLGVDGTNNWTTYIEFSWRVPFEIKI